MKNDEQLFDSLELFHYSCSDFVSALASNLPAPGGGGASALVGAIGMALGNMIGSLTIQNQKYSAVHEEMFRLKKEADALQTELLDLIQKDADVFQPLAKAYKLPTGTEKEKSVKLKVMEKALDDCCQVPLKIMACSAKAIVLLEQFAEKGTVMAVSDAGVGAVACEAALKGGLLNVRINTKSMKDREKAKIYNREADALIQEYVPRAEALFCDVNSRFD